MKSVDVAVIGGGPAGLSAAIEATDRGAAVALIDEGRSLGGKVLQADDGGLAIEHTDALETSCSGRLPGDFDRVAHKILLYRNTEVWAVHSNKVVELYSSGRPDRSVDRIQARTLIVADGAIERSVPFPGWTKPGVYTVGGLNALVKKGVLPGKMFIVAGTGPLLLPLSYNLLKAGARIGAVVDASLSTAPIPFAFRYGWRLLPDAGLPKLRQGFRFLGAIRKNRVPVFRSHAVTAALGSALVDGVRLERIDEEGRPVAGTAKKIEADVLAVSYGLVPSLELSRLCGCEIRYDSLAGYWRVVHDENLETSVPGIFIAGDGLEIKGYAAALDQGRLAGLGACRSLNKIDDPGYRRQCRPLQKKLQRAARFGQALDALSFPGPGLLEMIADETPVCRCEEISFGQIRTAVANGAKDINDIKRRTRVGMGYCQGRICGQVMNELLWRLLGKEVEREMFTPRMPVRPVPFEVLAD